MIHLINDVTDSDVEGSFRFGGSSFTYDTQVGLWLPPDYEIVELSPFVSFLGHNVALSNEKPKSVPPTASSLWDSPETVTTEIMAYRGWVLKVQIDDNGKAVIYLRSMNFDMLWDGPTVVADETPKAESLHGLYAVGLLPHHEWNFVLNMDMSCHIWGRVALSGMVIEGDLGYRAERATIQELWLNPATEVDDFDNHSTIGLAKLLAERYQCDVSQHRPDWKELVASQASCKS